MHDFESMSDRDVLNHIKRCSVCKLGFTLTFGVALLIVLSALLNL